MRRTNINIDKETWCRVLKYRTLGIEVNISKICREGINKYLDGAVTSRINKIQSEIKDLKDELERVNNQIS